MARDILLSGESKNIEYKVTLPDKSGMVILKSEIKQLPIFLARWDW